MDQDYLLLYNDLAKFAVMKIQPDPKTQLSDGAYATIYFSENPKHLTNEQLIQGFSDDITDKSIKAKQAKQRFFLKYFKKTTSLLPLNFGNIPFKPIKSKNDIDFQIQTINEMKKNPRLNPYYWVHACCGFRALREQDLEALIKFFDDKQKEADIFNHRTFY